MSTISVSTLDLQASFGFGDRIGLATPGHVAALQQYGEGILPIFPQQSIREMSRTQRTPEGVMADALNGLKSCGWEGLTGADADHLKTEEDVTRTMNAGFTFFTIDPSDVVDEKADTYDRDTLTVKFNEVASRISWVQEYVGKSITLETGSVIEFDETSVQRAAVKYGLALIKASELAAFIREQAESKNLPYEIEVSVDETDQPTTLAEHYIIADQLIRNEVKLVSLAPRFIGEMEKGVDFIGDLDALEASMADHNAISELLGPYKLSLHSGSDKISMYTPFARATKGRFHVKTAGTSYLEALRVAALKNEDLFARIVTLSREHYLTDKATYHVHATLEDSAEASAVSAKELEKQYLECWEDVPEGIGFTAPGRQILHCCFGTVLTNPELGSALMDTLRANPETYSDVLCLHFGKHLKALKAGML
ncbi:tagaturonate epimerase family protein [Kiritimatiellota bacterium B12222]|nr:tagaturonate epimerase family protein [Kiritimatiellota bacterium B12222]